MISKKEWFRRWGFGSWEFDETQELDKKIQDDIYDFLEGNGGLFLFSDKKDFGNGFIIVKSIVKYMLSTSMIRNEAFLIEFPPYLMYNSDDKYSDILIRNTKADIVIYNEIAPAKYSEYQILKAYSLLNDRIRQGGKFIITSSLTPEEIVNNIGVAISKLITMNCKVIEL